MSISRWYQYAVLTEKLLPISFLSYVSSQNLPVGQLVEVPIRNSIEKGVIWQQSRVETIQNEEFEIENNSEGSSLALFNEENSEAKQVNLEVDKTSSSTSPITSTKYEVKEITNIQPYKFSLKNLNFWKSFAFNNFASLNRVFSASLESFDLLTKADWKIINEHFKLDEAENVELNQNTFLEKNSEQTEVKDDISGITIEKKVFTPKIKYLSSKVIDNVAEGDVESILRIMYLIRNVGYKNTILIFPETKLVKYWLSQINLKEFSDINLYTFTSGKDKASKITIKSLLLPNDQKSKKNVYFTTRAGLFLPFSDISAIMLIDESNSMHIQEQGGLYFDAREVVFLLASQFESDLYFHSNFPSVRFLEIANAKTNE